MIAREYEAMLFERFDVAWIDFVAVAVALQNDVFGTFDIAEAEFLYC